MIRPSACVAGFGPDDSAVRPERESRPEVECECALGIVPTKPDARHIEVKGPAKGTTSITVTRNQILLGLSQRGALGWPVEISLEMCSIVGELTPISIDGGSPMSTMQRIASAFVVLAAHTPATPPDGDITQSNRGNCFSNREASQVANAVDGHRFTSPASTNSSRQLAGQQAQIDFQERLQHAIEITRDKQDEFASVAQAEGVSLKRGAAAVAGRGRS